MSANTFLPDPPEDSGVVWLDAAYLSKLRTAASAAANSSPLGTLSLKQTEDGTETDVNTAALPQLEVVVFVDGEEKTVNFIIVAEDSGSDSS